MSPIIFHWELFCKLSCSSGTISFHHSFTVRHLETRFFFLGGGGGRRSHMIGKGCALQNMNLTHKGDQCGRCLSLIISLKPRTNDRNMSTQHIATLLGATCRNTSQHGGQTHATCWYFLGGRGKGGGLI